MFESRPGDASLGGHWDAWYGAIVHISGAKAWQIGARPPGDTNQPAQDIITRAGDILLVPKGLPHAVRTPREPGHSVHLSFALDRDSETTGHLAGREPQGGA